MMTHGHHAPRLLPLAVVALAVVALAVGCTGAPVAPVDGGDTDLPTPIDREATAAGPTSYKGLALRLTDTGAPTVTAVDGVVGVVCIGMSNASQECADFIVRRNGEYDAAVNPAVRIVNCAVGGHAVERWIDAQYDATLWDACIGTKLAAAGVRPDQVRVVYHKAANQFTTGAGGAALPT